MVCRIAWRFKTVSSEIMTWFSTIRWYDLSTCSLFIYYAVSSHSLHLQPLRTSFLIESSGPLSLDLNCFYNNQVGVAAVGSYVADVDFSLNYGLNSSGSICEFLAAFETSVQFELYAPACVGWDDDRNADSCLDSQTKTPTIPPTGYPSASPSMEPAPSSYPSLAPSSVPSISPYPTITAAPTRITEAPSASPTLASGSSSMCVLMSALGTAVLSLWML